MKSSMIKATIFLAISILIFTISVQSKPVRQKRWTFNSWRLHGQQFPSYLSSGSAIGLICYCFQNKKN